MRDQLPPDEQGMAVLDLDLYRERAREHQLTDEDMAALTGIPVADWDGCLTPHTLSAAALFALARALDTPLELLLCERGHTRRPRRRPQSLPGAAAHTTVLHAALLETGRIHPDDLASALQWSAHRLQRAAKALADRLEQQAGPHRLVHTDTMLHLVSQPGLLTAGQQQNLNDGGHTAASLSPGEAAALTRLLHCAVRGLPATVPAEQIPRLAGCRLLDSSGGQPAPHPDVLFALGLADHPLPATFPAADADGPGAAAAGTSPPAGGG